MGFLKRITTDTGIEVENAYHLITYIEGDESSIMITLKVYASVDVYETNRNIQPIAIQNYYFIPDTSDNASNIFKQANDFLKTLPEFSGAAEV